MSSGGDREVVQSSEPFRQQLPHVQEVFNLANARKNSLIPGATSQFTPGAGVGTGVGNIGYTGNYGDFGRLGNLPGVGIAPPGRAENPPSIDNSDPYGFNAKAAAHGLPTLQFYPGQTVAGFDSHTLMGQGLARGGVENVAANNEQANSAVGRLLNKDPFSNAALDSLLQNPDPSRDPTVAAFADAATRPLIGQRDALLNADDDRAISQGAFGGSRQNLTRGQIRNDFAQRVGDVRAGIYNNAYAQQLGAQQNALGIAASADQSNTAAQLGALSQVGAINQQNQVPADVYSRIGAQNENLNQSLLDAERERFEFEQAAPDLAINQFSNLINQFSGPTTASSTSAGGSSGLGNVLGGALAGYAGRSLFSGG